MTLFFIKEKGGFVVTVESNSMQPALSRGDVVYAINETKYYPGDVVVFSYNDQLYVHRIMFSETDGYRTKGDASPNLDLWTLTGKNIMGKMVFKVPALGRITLFLKSR